MEASRPLFTTQDSAFTARSFKMCSFSQEVCHLSADLSDLKNTSRTISRVMSRMIIYLGRLLPAASSDLPEAGGPRHCFCSVLLRMGFTCALPVTRKAVVSYTAFPPLPLRQCLHWRYISVALSWESPPPDVIRHPAL